MKRRHGAVVYVPERERELIARLVRLSKGAPSARGVAAVYREILSSSRAAQGQAPIGLLQAGAPIVLPAGRAAFGACDQFAPKSSWRELAKGLGAGELSLVLLTGEELAAVASARAHRKDFLQRFEVAGEFVSAPGPNATPAQPLFIVTPRANGVGRDGDRIVILIECKSTLNAIKSLLHAMPGFSFHAEPLGRRAASAGVSVVRLSGPGRMKGAPVLRKLLAAAETAGVRVHLLGIYPATEVYGG